MNKAKVEWYKCLGKLSYCTEDSVTIRKIEPHRRKFHASGVTVEPLPADLMEGLKL